jgi:hypothetical protein
MPAKEQAFRPSVSDAAVEAATGRQWAGWFGVLDEAKATSLSHRDIARLLHEKHKLPGWWAQTVTVNFERARGLRAKYQKAGGFSVSVSKTIEADVATLYRAVVTTAIRVRWLPTGDFKISSRTRDKYVRGAWKLRNRIDFGFIAKGAKKAQIAVQIDKLKDAHAVEAERAVWKKALTKLSNLLEG